MVQHVNIIFYTLFSYLTQQNHDQMDLHQSSTTTCDLMNFALSNLCTKVACANDVCVCVCVCVCVVIFMFLWKMLVM